MALEDFKNILATTASISGIVQFLSGILICRKIILKGTCGDTSCFPFVVGFVSCCLWLRYGYIIDDISFIIVNSVGAFLQLAYVAVYLLYSTKKVTIIKQLTGLGFLLFCALTYAHYETDIQAAKHWVGLICCSFTLLFFFSPFTVLAHVIRTKNAECLPFPLIVTTFVVSFQWFVYGILLHDAFIQIPNGIGCTLSATQLSLFLIYPSTNVGKVEKWISKESPNRIL